MKTFKGTKGEWKLLKVHDERYIIKSSVDICDLFGNLGNGFAKGKEFEANAKLIAAAPDLLEALQIVYTKMNASNYSEKEFDLVEKAISKALD